MTKSKESLITSGKDAGLTKARATNVAKVMALAEEHLAIDAVRIEIDVEYADGGRVKLEAKA